MKLRFRTWLAAALLLAMAAFGAPAVRLAIPKVQTSIVWVDRSHGAHREVSKPRETTPPARSHTVLAVPVDGSPAPSLALDRSLFQRPPPSAFRS